MATEQEYHVAMGQRKKQRRDLAQLSLARHACEQSLADMNTDLDRLIKQVRKTELVIADWEGRVKVLTPRDRAPLPRRFSDRQKDDAIDIPRLLSQISTDDLVKMLRERGMTAAVELPGEG